MSNTVEKITIPAGKSPVVVQTRWNAAMWTFVQAFLGAFAGLALPILAIIQADLADGPPFDSTNLTLLAWFALSGVAAGIGAVISLVKNWLKPTLPAGRDVDATVT